MSALNSTLNTALNTGYQKYSFAGYNFSDFHREWLIGAYDCSLASWITLWPLLIWKFNMKNRLPTTGQLGKPAWLNFANACWQELAQVIPFSKINNRQQQAMVASWNKILQWSSQDNNISSANLLAHNRPIQITTILDSGYPVQFLDLIDPPPVIWSTLPLNVFFDQPFKLAVIGSRAMSNYGRQVTKSWVAEFVNQFNIAVVSGCAPGVDRLAQQTAINNFGVSLGVLGCGLEQASFWVNQQIKMASDKKSAISTKKFTIFMSEFPPQYAAQKWCFVRRNRLIAASADALLVVEAKAGSGTLITADFALQLGKDVFVVPQSLLNQNKAGIFSLLDQGANLAVDPTQLAVAVWGATNAQAACRISAEQQGFLQFLQENDGQVILSDALVWLKEHVKMPVEFLEQLQQQHLVEQSFGVVKLGLANIV